MRTSMAENELSEITIYNLMKQWWWKSSGMLCCQLVKSPKILLGDCLTPKTKTWCQLQTSVTIYQSLLH